jgi:hypothetical protein
LNLIGLRENKIAKLAKIKTTARGTHAAYNASVLE